MISSIRSPGIHAYSTVVRTQQAFLPIKIQTIANNAPQVSSATHVTISTEAYHALRADEASSKSNEAPLSGVAFIANEIRTDPDFANEMAFQYSHVRDYELVSLSELPLFDGSQGTGKYTSMDQYLQHVSEFEKTANQLMIQRQQIYDQMKAQGAPGVDIFTRLMEFNRTLPKDYLQSTQLNVMVESFLGNEV